MITIPVKVVNDSATDAVGGPVSAGMPFRRGALEDPGTLSLSAAGGPAPLQASCLSRWPDGSCRWVLLDFQADAPAGGVAEYILARSGDNPAPADAVSTTARGDAVEISNGIITLAAERGGGAVKLASADGAKCAEIVSTVAVGGRTNRIASTVVIDSLKVYASGPVRAAVALHGRRAYSDGIEGPFSQRVEMFAGSPWVRVEDTFVYSHFPGTHARPRNPLALWQVEVRDGGADFRIDSSPRMKRCPHRRLTARKGGKTSTGC